MLNVCTPSAEEQKEIASALARVPKQPLFGTDFEVSRGRSTLTDMPAFLQAGQRRMLPASPRSRATSACGANSRCRRCFRSVQYSFSNDGQKMVETLVLHVRDPKDLIQVSLEDSASAVTSSDAMLAANTPVSRIRLERFGKVVGRAGAMPAAEGGPAPDQSAYEPLFRSASEVLANYRGLLGREGDRAGGTGEDQRGMSKTAAGAEARAKAQALSKTAG